MLKLICRPCQRGYQLSFLVLRSISTEPSAGGTQEVKKETLQKKNLSSFEKRILVLTGRYPAIDKIPDQLPVGVMFKARDKFRIYAATALMLLTCVAYLFVIRGAKKDRAAGNTILKKSLAWHEELRPGSTTDR